MHTIEKLFSISFGRQAFDNFMNTAWAVSEEFEVHCSPQRIRKFPLPRSEMPIRGGVLNKWPQAQNTVYLAIGSSQ